MAKLHELAEQAIETALEQPNDFLLRSESGETKLEVPATFIVEYTNLLTKEVFDWVVENVGLMDEAQWEDLKAHIGLE